MPECRRGHTGKVSPALFFGLLAPAHDYTRKDPNWKQPGTIKLISMSALSYSYSTKSQLQEHSHWRVTADV